MTADEIRNEPESWNEEARRHPGREEWDRGARAYARTARNRLRGADRGVVIVCDGVLLAFGHDYADRGRAQAAIDSARACIASGPGMEELGFGLDESGQTWAMLIENRGEDRAAFIALWEAMWGPMPDGPDIESLAAVAEAARLGAPDGPRGRAPEIRIPSFDELFTLPSPDMFRIPSAKELFPGIDPNWLSRAPKADGTYPEGKETL